MTSAGMRARLTIWLTNPRYAFAEPRVAAAVQEEDGPARLGVLRTNPPALDADFVDRLESDIVSDGSGGNEGVVDRPWFAACRAPKVGEPRAQSALALAFVRRDPDELRPAVFGRHRRLA
jgi:hypothetical protein